MFKPLHKVDGGCHCGNIAVEAQLTDAPENYHPRACDCDFCRKHAAGWISDVRGTLRIRIKNAGDSGMYQQGSRQAELLLCRQCGVLVAAMFLVEKKFHAAVNVRALAHVQFGAEQVVSPQKLPATDKTVRWQDIWFAHVDIQAGEPSAPCE